MLVRVVRVRGVVCRVGAGDGAFASSLCGAKPWSPHLPKKATGRPCRKRLRPGLMPAARA